MHRLGVLTRGVGIAQVGFVLVELLLAAASAAVPRRTGARLSGQCFLVDLHGRDSNRTAITAKSHAWPGPANQPLPVAPHGRPPPLRAAMRVPVTLQTGPAMITPPYL